jgi:hypothetical protein
MAMSLGSPFEAIPRIAKGAEKPGTFEHPEVRLWSIGSTQKT